MSYPFVPVTFFYNLQNGLFQREEDAGEHFGVISGQCNPSFPPVLTTKKKKKGSPNFHLWLSVLYPKMKQITFRHRPFGDLRQISSSKHALISGSNYQQEKQKQKPPTVPEM